MPLKVQTSARYTSVAATWFSAICFISAIALRREDIIVEDVLTVEGMKSGRRAFPEAFFFRLCKAATAAALKPQDASLWRKNFGEVSSDYNSSNRTEDF